MEKQAFPLLSACRVLIEYLGKDFLKELNMAFVSIGQKYGFVSIGDYFRQQMAEERQQMTEERLQLEKKLAKEHDKLNKAEEEKLRTARGLYKDKVPIEILVKRFNLTKEQILGK